MDGRPAIVYSTWETMFIAGVFVCAIALAIWLFDRPRRKRKEDEKKGGRDESV